MSAVEMKFRQCSGCEDLTKFGGLPRWVGEPQWPISPGNGKPMTFIAQVELAAILGPDGAGKVAYVFINTDPAYEDSTWDPAVGETAVVIQPGEPSCITKPLTSGPVIGHRHDSDFNHKAPAEFAVEFADIDPDKDEETYNRFGGEPIWVQWEEAPFESAVLVFQLEDLQSPVDVNFGTGVGYVFVDLTGSKGALVWQC